MLFLTALLNSASRAFQHAIFPHDIGNGRQQTDNINMLLHGHFKVENQAGFTQVEASGTGKEMAPLLPRLVRLTQQRKWVILVSPPSPLPMRLMHRAGANPARFMVVQVRSPEARQWALLQALRHSPGGAVLFWAPVEPDAAQHTRLQEAVAESESSCIAFIKSSNNLIENKKAA